MSRIEKALDLLTEEFGSFILLASMADGNIAAVSAWAAGSERSRKLISKARPALEEMLADGIRLSRTKGT